MCKNAPNGLVDGLLVEFSRLDKTDQAEFIECLNQFLFASSGQRRRLRQKWLEGYRMKKRTVRAS